MNKAFGDAKIPFTSFDEYERNYNCEHNITIYAQSCYILIYSVQNYNSDDRKIYEQLIDDAKDSLRTYGKISIKLKITPPLFEYSDNQIKEALEIVKDNLIHEGFLKG